LKLLKSNQQGIKKIALNSHDGFEIIDTDTIILLEAEGSYTKFYLKNNNQHLSSNGIGEYENLLDSNTFIRIHKSYIININEVKKYIRGDGGSVILSNEKEAFVSKRKKEFFLSMFKK
jgi:two-component system LytT family response regulator